MIEILHISNTDIYLDNRIRKEMKAISKLCGVRISVVGISDANGEAGESEVDDMRYVKLHMSSRVLRLLPRAVRYCFEIVEFTVRVVFFGWRIKPDVIHCHDAFALPAGWILNRAVGCLIVYDAHELESKKNAQNAILSKATLIIERICWNQVTLFISVSDSIIDWYMQNLGFKPSVLVLNSPYIDKDACTSFENRERGLYFNKKFKIPDSHLIFVYLGILGPGRGIDICLEAFAAGPDNAHVIFIGFGHLDQTIKTYSERHSNIHLHHAVPHDQVVPLISGADYGLCLVENVSLSDYYCLPNKLFEYVFARLPVLASDFPEIRRLVEQYSLGVFCEPRPIIVQNALAKLVGERPYRIESDIKTLSWECQAERLRQAYKNEVLVSLDEKFAQRM